MNQIITLILALAVCALLIAIGSYFGYQSGYALLIAIGSYFGYQSGYLDALEEYIEDQDCKQIKP